MWAYEVGSQPYLRLLDGIERTVRGTTHIEQPKRW